MRAIFSLLIMLLVPGCLRHPRSVSGFLLHLSRWADGTWKRMTGNGFMGGRRGRETRAANFLLSALKKYAILGIFPLAVGVRI
jgi:hypothetical protein